jgi:hypothetical protein
MPLGLGAIKRLPPRIRTGWVYPICGLGRELRRRFGVAGVAALDNAPVSQDDGG